MKTISARVHQFRSVVRLAAVAAIAALAIFSSSSDWRSPLRAQAPNPCAAPVTNPVACENTLPGNPASEWDVDGAGSPSIQGFATDISVNHGGTVHFKVDTDATSYRLDIYRLGYYGGDGARLVATVNPAATLPQVQPPCMNDPTTGLVDCGVWNESASWAVPATAVSGVYLAKLVRTDGTDGASHIVFVVRDDSAHSPMLFQTSDTTWQAYNRYGGNSLYVGGPGTNPGRAFKVSYNRPITTRGTGPEDFVFNAEYPMIRWLEANGYNVSYASGVDSDRRGAALLDHQVILSVGHDEYWSGTQRANFEAARAAGVNLAFFSGNEMFWKTRWEPSIDGSNTDHRTLVCYKETHANAKIDPEPTIWTGTWRDPRFSPPADGGRPENAMTGTIFTVNDPGTFAIQVPAAYGHLRFWRNTSIATLAPDQTATLTDGTLGYEWDEALANGAQPAGLVHLSQTTENVPSKLLDYGSTYGSGTATHSLTLYRDPTSSALVFGAGTVQWSWGLDANHDRGNAPADLRMQQATLNLFSDMGVAPSTPQPGLVVSPASTDTVAPAVTITSPTGGATVLAGADTAISGTAADTGGIIAGVEVSTDGGASWAPASGGAAWTYTWTPAAAGSATLIARAVDDSGNAGVSATVPVTVSAALPPSCPCSLWPDSVVPPQLDAGADDPVELGVKFTSNTDGFITALRFYKAATNTGAHVGNLWQADGTLLASAAFTNETASGWQVAPLTTAVPVTANQTYVVSYHTTVGHYSFGTQYFVDPYRAGPLTAPADSTTPNGVFKYGSASAMPTESYRAGNYYVDVVFNTSSTDTTPPTVIATSPGVGATGVDINTNVSATFSEAMNAGTINSTTVKLLDGSSNVVPGLVSYDAATHSVIVDPSGPLALGATYTGVILGGSSDPRAKDTAGNALASTFSWSFTVASDTTPPTVTAVLPGAGATGVPFTSAVSATFSEAMDASTVNGSTLTLRDASNNVISAAVAYDTATHSATLTPTAPLAASSVYTATVRGGALDPRVKDAAGNALAADVSWSFTTTAALPSGCPCTLWTDATTPAVIDGGDSASVELGVKFQSDDDGFITGIRFYKAATNTGTHVAHLWTATGTLLASATFGGETAAGWQTVSFASPVPVTANTTYVASYFAPAGHYSFSSSYFNTAHDAAPLHALATTTSPNGVYQYASSGAFPNQTFRAANYWVDVIYSTTASSADTTPPSVSSTSPVTGASGVLVHTTVAATFSEAIDPATIDASTFFLQDASSTLVPATISWNAASRTAILQPSAPLAFESSFTAVIKGGPTDPRIKDLAGNALASDYTWSFTTGTSLSTDPTQGPGGPILVVTDPSNPFGTYYAEILRAEGLNEFAVANLSTVDATALSGYDVVVLSEVALTDAQASMFATWVNAGGNLIAMRPDKKLAGLLGLTDAGGTLSNGYLLMNTSTGPAAGLVNTTIQFHGTADRYALNGATSLATLYSAATVATPNPAVTLRTLGGTAGHAAAFAYDLAQSVVYTRQGNPAWAGQDRDGLAPIRSDDLFFGNAASDPQPDWVDFNKIAIPQADEQQRLLANLIVQMNIGRKPLPRFWFLPSGFKAAVVMTGDDHGSGHTVGRFDAYKAASPVGCSVADWQCIRSTAYIYNSTPITDAQAAAYTADGFEIALHATTNCSDFTPASLAEKFDTQYSTFDATFPSATPPRTNRTHCIPWSDYATEPQVELAHGVRFDATYYYWPGTWVLDRPGLFTGSGMPMRFATAGGTMIDVYQAATQMTDESEQTYPLTITTLLDNAVGPLGYYGVFTANMHNDTVASPGSDAILAAAQARGVPIVSSRQMLDWLDGRNGSSFGSLVWTAGVEGGPQGGSTLAFTVKAAAGAHNLQGMLPRRLTTGAGVLTGLTFGGTPVAFDVATIKGIEYVRFAAQTGSYVATYDTTPPNTSLTATPPALTNTATANFAFAATEANSTFECRLDAGSFASCVSPVTFTGLPTGVHAFQVRATDLAGNVDPTPAAYSWTIDVTPPAITGRTPGIGTVGVSSSSAVTVTFDEVMSSSTINVGTLRIRPTGSGTDLPATVSLSGSVATLQPTSPLLLGGQYTVTVAGTVADGAGNPMGADAVWSFTVQNTLVDTTVADFGAGSPDASGIVSDVSGGEVMLAPANGSDFGGSALPAGWSTTKWSSTGSAAVGGGSITVDGARVSPAATYAPGRVLEFLGTFGTQSYQHVGFGLTFNETPWAMFSTGSGNALYARTHNGSTAIDTLIPGTWAGTPHRYRIVWNATSVVFFIDGTQVASHATTISTALRPIISDFTPGGQPVSVNWMRLTPYAAASTFVSRVMDGNGLVTWGTASWTTDLPAGTSVAVSIRTGNSATPDGTWSAWTSIATSGGAIGRSSRYLQYRVTLSTTDSAQSPALRDMTISGSVQ